MVRAEEVWLEESLKSIMHLIELQEDLAKGEYKYKYDPSLLPIGEINAIMSKAERDGIFSDYGVNVTKEIIFFEV